MFISKMINISSLMFVNLSTADWIIVIDFYWIFFIVIFHLLSTIFYFRSMNYFNFNLLSLSELLITEILLRAMAAAANIGLISIPIRG